MLNTSQKAILAVGLVVFLSNFCCLPWKWVPVDSRQPEYFAEYAPPFITMKNEHHRHLKLETTILAFQLVVVIVVTVALVLLLGKPQDAPSTTWRDSTEEDEPSKERTASRKTERVKQVAAWIIVVWIVVYLLAGFIMRDNLLRYVAGSIIHLVGEIVLAALCFAGCWLCQIVNRGETKLSQPNPLHDEIYLRQVEVEEAIKRVAEKRIAERQKARNERDPDPKDSPAK